MSLRIHVRSGTTPGERLCDTCEQSVIMQGEGQEEQVFCTGVGYEAPIEINKIIVRCSAYKKKESGPSLRAMEGMAMIITESGPLRNVGFMTAKEWRKRHADDELVPDEATRRLT